MKVWPVVTIFALVLAGTAGFLWYRANRYTELQPIDRALAGAEFRKEKLEKSTTWTLISGAKSPTSSVQNQVNRLYVIKKNIDEVVEALDKQLAGSNWHRSPSIRDMIRGNGDIVFSTETYMLWPSSTTARSFGSISVMPGKASPDDINLGFFGFLPSFGRESDRNYTTVAVRFGPVEPDWIDKTLEMFQPKKPKTSPIAPYFRVSPPSIPAPVPPAGSAPGANGPTKATV